MARMGRRPKGAPAPEPREKFTTTLPPELIAWAKARLGERGVGEWIEAQLTALKESEQDAAILAAVKAGSNQ